MRLADLAQVARPALNVVEGVVGRDGTGFARGRNYPTGLVIVGTNMWRWTHCQATSWASTRRGSSPSRSPSRRAWGSRTFRVSGCSRAGRRHRPLARPGAAARRAALPGVHGREGLQAGCGGRRHDEVVGHCLRRGGGRDREYRRSRGLRESFVKGRLVGRGWNGSGFVSYYDGRSIRRAPPRPGLLARGDGQAPGLRLGVAGHPDRTARGGRASAAVTLEHAVRPVRLVVAHHA